jgi:D-beta-D-heptose 7-phosphate kinase/D-beta-D-heptose 1-phosphate adenosyltransferase|tara:strand:- start:439 stop:822 length:384 start_codon:yes stop_codon:yes gene_type:complete
MKIWINGCFDVLHHGHFQLIAYAKSLGDTLTIGIDSDRRVKESKGDGRPFHNQKQRIYNLFQISGVNGIVVFDSDKELSDAIKEYQPDIFVIGEEYKDKGIIGRKHAKRIEYFPKVEGFSTTGLLDE